MPAKLLYDAELMRHQAPAIPVSPSRSFSVILDEHHRPIVFSIGTDKKFYLIMSDDRGVNILYDLGGRLGFSTDAQAFAVTQLPDLTILVAFAMTHDKNHTEGDLYVLGPLKPAELLKADKSSPRRTMGQEPHIIFDKIYLSPMDQENRNATIIVVRENEARDMAIGIARTDIARVLVTKDAVTWMSDLDLPQNPDHVQDLCPGIAYPGSGIFYLYTVGQTQTIVFISTETFGGGFERIGLKLPPPSTVTFTSLATFTDTETKFSKLLASGGKAVYIFPTIRRDAESKVLSNDPIYDGVDELYCAQSDNHLSIWFKNGQQILGYHEGDYDMTNNKFNAKPPIPLTTAGQAAQYTPIIDPGSKSQRLLVANTAGILTLKEQAVDSRLWKDTPFNVQHPTEYQEFATYTVHIKVADASGAPLANEKVLLSSSDWVTATVNGQTFALSTLGVSVSTDARGTLAIVVPTSDLTAYTFVVKDVPGTTHFSAPVSIDPTTKVFEQFKNMTSTRLREAKSADGKPLFDSKTDFDKVAKAVTDMYDLKKTLHSKDQTSSSASLVAVGDPAGALDIIDDFWDGIHWIKEQWHRAKNWIVHQVQNVWHFVVELAEKTWTFILDTAEHIMAAIQWVFKKIGAAFEKIVEWLGFIFSWGDILDTSDQITNMVNGLLSFGTTFFTIGGILVDKYLDDMIKSLDKTGAIADDLQKETTDPYAHEGHGDHKTGPALDSAPANWSNYHLQHSGVKESIDPGKIDPDSDLDSIFGTVIQTVWTTIRDSTKNISSDVLKAYSHNPHASMGDILKQVGIDILKTLLKAIKSIVHKIVELGAKIITDLTKILNREINVPILSALFKFITKGRSLTLLNALSLLVAAPVTIVAKIVTGRNPKRINFSQFNYTTLVLGKIDKTTLEPYIDLAGWVTTIYYFIDGIVEIYKIVTYEAEVKPDSPVSPTMVDIGLKLLLLAFTFPYNRDPPSWPMRVSIWSTIAGNTLIGSVLQRNAVSVKATVAFDMLTGLITFVLAQVGHNSDFTEKWVGKDDVDTTLDTVLSVLSVISAAVSGYGQLSPDKATPTIVVGAAAVGESVIKGVISAYDRAKQPSRL